MRQTLNEVYRVAKEELGLPRERVKLGGPPVDSVAISTEGERTLAWLLGPAAIVGLNAGLLVSAELAADDHGICHGPVCWCDQSVDRVVQRRHDECHFAHHAGSRIRGWHLRCDSLC